MKKLSKTAETKLLSAIEKTASLVNDGSNPNAAIAKSAQANGVPAGHINLLVHAFNTGRTAKQRQADGDVLEKVADFELADASKVLEILYPETVKTAAAVERSNAVSFEYGVPPDGLLGRKARREKQSRQVDWSLGAKAPEPYPGEPGERAKRAVSEADRGKREVEEARRVSSAIFDKMANTFCELSNYFRRPGCQPIPIVREQATLLHGGKAEEVFDQLIQVTPGLAKMSHNIVEKTSGFERATGPAYGMIATLIEQIGQYKEAKAEFEKMSIDTAAHAEELLRPFVEGLSSVLEDSTPSLMTEGGPTLLEKAAVSPFVGLLGAGVIRDSLRRTARGMQGPPRQSQVQQQLDQMADPEHESALRNIRTEAMLQDLMLNDPVIAGSDPDDVIEMFNQIVQASPRAADQRLVMQAMLRKNLSQGHLESFDVNELLGMEGSMRQRDTPDPPPKSVMDAEPDEGPFGTGYAPPTDFGDAPEVPKPPKTPAGGQGGK